MPAIGSEAIRDRIRRQGQAHASGDLAGFEARDDAVAYATKRVEGWPAGPG